MKPYRKLSTIMIFAGLVLSATSCKKYLDEKPDQKLAVPVTLPDLQAILDHTAINQLMPYAADIGSDEYFLQPADLAFLTSDNQLAYRWDGAAASDQDWANAYTMIERCNVVLDGLDHINSGDPITANQIRGSALFFRGYYYLSLANIYTLPYDASRASSLPGLPLRRNSDISAVTVRNNMQETYAQIVADLQASANLLNSTPTVKTRPGKPAAFGALARTFLVLGDHERAGKYADSALRLSGQLIDYNSLNANASQPIARFNDEVIFHATSSGRDDVLSPLYARVDPLLYGQYTANDLRRSVLFEDAGDGYKDHKGNYSGDKTGAMFSGIATDELLLIRAEAAIRQGQINAGIADVNTLLTKRFKTGTFTPYSAGVPSPLALVLSERRKELAFRSGLRWMDLRRLNTDPGFAQTLTRRIEQKTYSLPPGDKRYAFLIPASVVQISGISQNER